MVELFSQRNTEFKPHNNTIFVDWWLRQKITHVASMPLLFFSGFLQILISRLFDQHPCAEWKWTRSI